MIVLTTMLGIRAAVAAVPLNDSREDAGELGDTLQYVVPAAALALTWVLSGQAEQGASAMSLNADSALHLGGTPRHDLALAFGRSIVATEALKFTFNEKRPNGGDHSFPSGHTSFAFTGAEFIRKEYGWRWAVPAFGIASYVGFSRVRSREHHTHDVLAGALIGILANHDLREVRTRHGILNFGPTTAAMDGSPAMGLQFSLDF
jgi:membrane-associated phospholipid phosphatase